MADLECFLWLRVTLNFQFSCPYFPRVESEARATTPALGSAGQGSLQARWARYQLSYVRGP